MPRKRPGRQQNGRGDAKASGSSACSTNALSRPARLPSERGTEAVQKGSPACHPVFAPARRLVWLKATPIVAFSIGLLLSSHLWIGPRSYPTVPVVDGLPALSGVAAKILFAALFILAAAILAARRPQPFIAAFLAILAAFCLLDQTRWQPWVFLYGFMLSALALFSWNPDDAAGLRRTLNIARLMVACTYIFSGLQKINANFMHNDFLWIVAPVIRALPWSESALRLFGMVVPFVQIAFGAGLLTRRFRRVSLVTAVAMHLFILSMLGPAGLDWNDAVWPWTAAMAVFDLLLFTNEPDYSVREVLWTPGRPDHAVALALFGILPLLSFVNLWDSYLSAALYSGNLTEAQIYLTDAGRASLPPSLAGWLVWTSEDTNVLNLQRWAIEDLNVTPYPEARAYRGVAKAVCGLLADQSQLVLIVREQRLFFSRPETGYRCWQL